MLGKLVQDLKTAHSTESRANLWNKYAATYPNWLRNASDYGPGQWEDTKDIPFVRKLGLLGTAISGAQTWNATEHGADPAKEWTKFGVNTGVGLGISEAVAAAIPGPGWAYIVGSTASIPVSYAVDNFVDHWGDGSNWDLKHIENETEKEEDYMLKHHIPQPY